MKTHFKKLLITNVLTTMIFFVWLLLTPSLSNERVFLSYSSYRLVMNVIALFVLVFFLICLWTLRFQSAERIFEKIFQSRWFTFFILVAISALLQSLILYLIGFFEHRAIYYEKLSPILLLFLILSIEMIGYQYYSSNGEKIRFLYSSIYQVINNKTPILIGVVFITYFTIIFFTLSSGHTWGDDFAHYLSQATSLLTGTVDEFIQGRILTITYSPQKVSPVTVPWGYPIFLLPFVKLFNQNILALKLSNVIAFTGFLIITYKWVSLRLSKPAALFILGFFAFSPIFIQFHEHVLTDLFFLFLSMTSLLLIDLFINRYDKNVGVGILLGFTIFYASFTRTSGFLLIITLLFAQIVNAFDHKKKAEPIEIQKLIVSITPYIVFAFFYGLQEILLVNEQMKFNIVADKVSLQTILGQVEYNFLELQNFFIPIFHLKILFYTTIFLVILGIFGNSKSLSSWIVVFYGCLTLGMYIVFPGQQGIRYLFPILPIIILYIFLGGKSLLAMIKAKNNLAILFILFFACFSIFAQFGIMNVQYAILNMKAERINVNGPFHPKMMEMFEYVRENTEPDDIIVFFKPRAMKYLTNRNSFIMIKCEEFVQGDYLVWLTGELVEPGQPQMSFEELQGCIVEKRLTLVFSNDVGSVFEIMQE